MNDKVIQEIEDLILTQKLNCSVMKFREYVKENFYGVCIHAKKDKNDLSEDFIIEFKNEIHIGEILSRYKLSENCIREIFIIEKGLTQKEKMKKEDGCTWTLKDRWESFWKHISSSQELSEDFIREFQDRVDWTLISKHQKLSEEFIREFQDRVDWEKISRYQRLSEKFIGEFKDKVDWEKISWNQKLSSQFLLEFKYYIYWNIINQRKDMDKEQEIAKKEKLKKEEELKAILEIKKMQDIENLKLEDVRKEVVKLEKVIEETKKYNKRTAYADHNNVVDIDL